MNFPYYIAKRYLFSKKGTNAINVISAVSMGGIAVATMALIVVLSVFRLTWLRNAWKTKHLPSIKTSKQW